MKPSGPGLLFFGRFLITVLISVFVIRLFIISISARKKGRKINKIRNEKGEVTTDNAEIQRIIRDYYEQLYGNKMDNLEEMDRFLEKFNLPRLNQEEIEIMNNPIVSTEIEALIKNSPKKQKPSIRWFYRKNRSNI